jgi:hypothetical protein
MPKDATAPVERRRTLQVDDATRAVQLGAAVLLGGGEFHTHVLLLRHKQRHSRMRL